MIQGFLIEGLIYSLMVLGVFITFRLLDFADMTVDGSFPLGGCIMGMLLTQGYSPLFAIAMAFIGGMLAGLITALIHTKLKIPGLLAGILTMTMLMSINLRIMKNGSNLSLLRTETFFSWITEKSSGIISPDWAIVISMFVVVIIIKILLDVFFHTDFGLTLGALGSNSQLIISQGMNPNIIKVIGICLSNGLVGLSGAITAMYQGFADVGAGTGLVVSGLASLMLGEFVLRSNKISILTLRVIIGSIIYRGLMYFARTYGYKIGMNPNDLKLVTGLLIIMCMIISQNSLLGTIKRSMSKGGSKCQQ